MALALLPAQFSELESHARVWCLPTEHERYARRLASGMDELQAFYDAFFPRVEEAIAYCDEFSLEEMPDEVQHLMQLIYSLILVSLAVEAWRQPRVPDSGAACIERVVEPFP